MQQCKISFLDLPCIGSQVTFDVSVKLLEDLVNFHMLDVVGSFGALLGTFDIIST